MSETQTEPQEPIAKASHRIMVHIARNGGPNQFSIEEHIRAAVDAEKADLERVANRLAEKTMKYLRSLPGAITGAKIAQFHEAEAELSAALAEFAKMKPK